MPSNRWTGSSNTLPRGQVLDFVERQSAAEVGAFPETLAADVRSWRNAFIEEPSRRHE
jgi:hypothetical protein